MTVRKEVDPNDPEIELLIPEGDEPEPELSIVVPALNEELTIAEFMGWCKEGIAKAGIKGEIIIVDSSKDKTPDIVVAHGGRVLRTPKRGLGRAYIDVVPHIRGKYIVMGDCDCTYDFRELVPFVEEFRKGAEYIMGSRFAGYIEDGAMPPLHRYFGTPLTTWILNVMYGSHFSDIHCGMRGMTLDALKRIDLRSQGWEYASELVLKSVHLRLKTAEVPIRFYKDKDGRLSHHKRSGWLSPWIAGWVNLRAMFIYGADFFLRRPGRVLLALGLLFTLPLSLGPVQLGSIGFSIYWMMLGVSLATLGLQCVYMGILSRIILDFRGEFLPRYEKKFPYDRTVWQSIGLGVLGFLCAMPLVVEYVRGGFRLAVDPAWTKHLAVTGLFGMIAGFMTFTFVLLVHGLGATRRTP
ncbi:MAG: glycosyltransferase family 2 protein [Polyangiaceae bacterium]